MTLGPMVFCAGDGVVTLWTTHDSKRVDRFTMEASMMSISQLDKGYIF